jgi:hypothetical protein
VNLRQSIYKIVVAEIYSWNEISGDLRCDNKTTLRPATSWQP